VRATQAIPLGDAGSFTRRARAVTRLRLALAAVALAAAAAFLAASLRPAPAPAALLPPSSSGVVVLDVSASISSDTYARIGATLDRLIRSDGAYGLVLFSDTAYQALPPHTPARELRPLRRFFEVGRQEGSGALPEAPRSPWTQAFGAGTRISTGLELALEVIRRDRLVDPAVLLVSDLDDDSGDVERVSRLAIAYRRAGIPLHVVGLNADPEDAAFIRRFLTEKGSFTEAALPSESSGRASRGVEPLLVALALIAAVGLGGIVFLSEPLRWRAT
jgi:hypothetical protein